MTGGIRQVTSIVSTLEDRRQPGDRGTQVGSPVTQPIAPLSPAQATEVHTIAMGSIACPMVMAPTVTGTTTQILSHSADLGQDQNLGTEITTITGEAFTRAITALVIAVTREA